MKKYLMIILFILSTVGLSYAYRISKPQRITDFNQNGLVILNEALEQLWNITNGRYTLDIVTSNPDGSLKGDVGDILLFNNSGTYYLEINTTGAKVWRGILLQDVP